MKQYEWQGEPVKVEFGAAAFSRNEEKPLYWYNYECRKSGTGVIDAVRITTKSGQTFIIANHFGIGVHKLLRGGWPNLGHSSIPDDCHFEGGKNKTGFLTEFDEEGYAAYESKREKWMEENFADHPDWIKTKKLKEAISKGLFLDNFPKL